MIPGMYGICSHPKKWKFVGLGESHPKCLVALGPAEHLEAKTGIILCVSGRLIPAKVLACHRQCPGGEVPNSPVEKKMPFFASIWVCLKMW